MNEISTIKDIFQEDSFMESLEKIDRYIFENTIKNVEFQNYAIEAVKRRRCR